MNSDRLCAVQCDLRFAAALRYRKTVGQHVEDFCMKCLRGLSGVALVSFLSVHSKVAMSKVPEQVRSPQQFPIILPINSWERTRIVGR